MSVKAPELSTTISADEFHALEEKVYRTIELLKTAREVNASDTAGSGAVEKLKEIDERWGEPVKVYIVLRDGQTATEQEITDYCRTRMAGYKVPKFVEFRRK